MAASGEKKRQYFAVEIERFRTAVRDIPFDVYLKLSEGNYAHVFSRATGLDYQRLAQYIRKGITHFYVDEGDRDSFDRTMSRTAEEILKDQATPPEKRIATLLNMTEQNMAELFSKFEVSEGTAETSKAVVRNYVDILSDDPKSLSIILKLVSHGEYLYYHSIATTIFAMFIAKATGQFNKKMLEIIGLGGFLHDIGCTQIPEEVSCSPSELTPEQWEEMKGHPQAGLKMIENVKVIPDEVRYIVYQHHEQPDGNGYPNSLRGNAIYYPAKIVSLSDSFSALISKRPFRPAFDVEDAVRMMAASKGKFDSGLVEILSTVFVQKLRLKKSA